jgi:hypothetical protein
MNDWTISSHTRVNGRVVTPGTEVTIRGERGRFRFVKHVRNGAGNEWVDVYGGPKGHETLRSFRPARIRTVHRRATMRTARYATVAVAA